MSLLENTHLSVLAAPVEGTRSYLHHSVNPRTIPKTILWAVGKDCDRSLLLCQHWGEGGGRGPVFCVTVSR